ANGGQCGRRPYAVPGRASGPPKKAPPGRGKGWQLCGFFPLEVGRVLLQEVGGFLCLGGGFENQPLVVLQCSQPALNVCGGLVKIGRQAKACAKHAITDFGNQFFKSVALAVAETAEAV